ncbi:phosphocholine cytidylyltransferase family protein [Amycolatopsis pithecellobii]|uniref:NTP transferase domain-containing protein n=1 Tax=Amycolatopsis pithecellobii TaxID=664692 RepID=A0A6N7Z2K5_9PSEU|nr:phosphocholine cytidylyltransferase family protein [Amycolatopsis pithecellobii]MTD54271.1 NTP transferase domain-containing protein [Amycolatopsis pithecellobii]
MKAVILGAGRGSRMGEVTADRPKCLIEIDGRSLLDRQCAAFRAAGFEDIGVVTGWQAERFTNLPVTLFHNPFWAGTSMVDSLACARRWLTAGPVVACYGDILVTPADIQLVARSAAMIAMAFDPNWLSQWSRRFTDPLQDAETLRLDADGNVTEIGGKPGSLTEIEGQYLGLIKLEPAGWARLDAAIARVGRRDMTGTLARLVASDPAAVQGVAIRGPWHEFDSARDLATGYDVVTQIDRLLSDVVEDRAERGVSGRGERRQGRLDGGSG